MTRRPDFVAGNTRLRARLPGLVSPGRAEQWTGLDLDGLESQLRGLPTVRFSGSAPGSGAAGSPASPGDRRYALLLAVETGHRDAQRAAAAAYSGAARAAVTALLTPWDAADLVTLVRAAARRLAADEVIPLVHAVGALTPGLLREVISDDPTVTLARLVDRRWPHPVVAAQLRDGVEAFARTEDLAGWEARVARALWRVRDAELAAMGTRVRPIREQLDRVRDETNLLAALRTRSPAASGGPSDAGPAGFLPAGALGVRELLAIAGGADPGSRVPASWRPHVARLDGELPDGGPPAPGVLSELARALEEDRLQAAAALVRRGDPLGAGVPVGYLARLELQARALRTAVEQAEEPAATAPAGAA